MLRPALSLAYSHSSRQLFALINSSPCGRINCQGRSDFGTWVKHEIGGPAMNLNSSHGEGEHREPQDAVEPLTAVDAEISPLSDARRKRSVAPAPTPARQENPPSLDRLPRRRADRSRQIRGRPLSGMPASRSQGPRVCRTLHHSGDTRGRRCNTALRCVNSRSPERVDVPTIIRWLLCCCRPKERKPLLTPRFSAVTSAFPLALWVMLTARSRKTTRCLDLLFQGEPVLLRQGWLGNRILRPLLRGLVERLVILFHGFHEWFRSWLRAQHGPQADDQSVKRSGNGERGRSQRPVFRRCPKRTAW